MLQSKSSNSRSIFIFITLVIEAMGFGIIMPVLPDIIRKFETTESKVATTLGLFIAVYALLQFLFAPVLGRLSDKYGRRPILLISLFGTGVDYIFMAFAPTLAWLFVGRIISGLAGASYTVATAYIADISDDSNRAKNFGLIGAGFGLGFIIGPAIGGLIGSQNLIYPFLFAAGLNLVNFLFGFFILPESLHPELRRNFKIKELNPFKSLSILGHIKIIFPLMIAYIFIQLAGQTHASLWAIYSEHRFSWTPSQVGVSLAVVGVLSALAQGVLTGYAVKWFSEANVAFWGILGESIGFVGYGLAYNDFWFYFVLITSSIFWVAHPAIQSLITKEISADRQGELQGALMSLTSLTAVVNPLIMTNIFSFSSVRKSDHYMPGAPYFLAAVFALTAFYFVSKWKKRNKAVSGPHQ